MPEGNSKTDLIHKINDAASQLGVSQRKFSFRNGNATTVSNYSPNQNLNGARTSQLTENSLKQLSPLRGVDNNEVVGRSKKTSRNVNPRFATMGHHSPGNEFNRSPQPTRRDNDLAVIQEKFNKIKKLFRPLDRTPPLFENVKTEEKDYPN